MLITRIRKPVSILLVITTVLFTIPFASGFAVAETCGASNADGTAAATTADAVGTESIGASDSTSEPSDTAAAPKEAAEQTDGTESGSTAPSPETEDTNDTTVPDNGAAADSEKAEAEPEEAVYGSDLRNFVRSVTVFGLCQSTPTRINPEIEPLMADTPYQFAIEFAETASMQLTYNDDGLLEYRLPRALAAEAAQGVPIRDASNAIIGRYAVDAAGLVTLRFDNPAYLTPLDVTFTLEIIAALMPDTSRLNFGNGIIIDILPVPTLTEVAAAEIIPLAVSNDLANFLTAAAMWDMSTTPPTEIMPGSTAYIGKSYEFRLTFAESTSWQMDSSAAMTYQLPSGLLIPVPIPPTPIYNANNVVVGSYTIDTSGLVSLTFLDVDQNGNATPGVSYVDNYTNVSVTLNISAQLMAGSGDLGFIAVQPIAPPMGFTVSKTSSYDPIEEVIHYMITITALNGPVSNIQFVDTPIIAGTNAFNNSPDAFSAFTYQANIGAMPGTLMPMPVNRITGTQNMFTYTFAETLNTGDAIIVRYSLDLKQFISNNPQLVPGLLQYQFTVQNNVAIQGSGSNGETDTEQGTSTDYVKKVFPITKTGVLVPPDGTNPYYRLQWTITIGDGLTTQLNDGTITDTLGPGLVLPSNLADITVTYSDNASPANTVTQDGVTAGIVPNGTDTGFTLTVPGTGLNGTPASGIYEIQIVFYTQINTPPISGQPPVTYTNLVDFADGNGNDYSASGRVPLIPPGYTEVLHKTTSGICGTPSTGYYVDYTIIVNVPAGLLGEPLWLIDDLGFFPGGVPITNDFSANISNFTISATPTNPGAPPLIPAFQYIGPVPASVGNTNTWAIFFGTTELPSQLGGSGLIGWPYNNAVTILVEYQIAIPPDTITALQNTPGSSLQNAAYLVNSTGPFVWGVNDVGGQNTVDYWPIFKTGQATGDPSLFDYTVTIKGGYSLNRPAPLLPATNAVTGAPSTPIYTDTFDSRMAYMPGSFYVVVNGTTISVPDANVNVAGNVLTVDFSAFGPANWFAVNNDFTVHYQLYLLPSAIPPPGGTLSPPALTNTAAIAVNPGQCTFENSTTVTYSQTPINKTMTPSQPGSDLIHVAIVINPDGSIQFAPSGGAAPPLVIAQDVLTNLMLYTDTIQFYTQTPITVGTDTVWDGNWIPQTPINFNTYSLPWSVNVQSRTVVDFVIPNGTPVMITYDALVTLPQGVAGTISNSISIYDLNDGVESGNYVVGNTVVGADASKLTLRVFKKDNLGRNLPGAAFSLYVTELPNYTGPDGLTETVTVGGQTFYKLGDAVTDANGMAIFDNAWINTSYNFLFMLVETSAPTGYTALYDRTFFTVNPGINPAWISAAEVTLGGNITNISDFISVINVPSNYAAGNLVLQKRFLGISNTTVQQNLQDFQIVIADPLGVETTYGLTDVLNPLGIVLENIQSGTYFITELNYEVPNYTCVVSPRLPLRLDVLPVDAAAGITLTIDNIYTPISPPEPPIPPVPPIPPIPAKPIGSYPSGPQTGDSRDIWLWIRCLILGLSLSGSTLWLGYRERRQKIGRK
ncbi:MAG: hypothetical protein FWE08_05170 [Oscillospiraceae bacterium]|nr:hypothetical protein [Oscillospiraceae bacterium]